MQPDFERWPVFADEALVVVDKPAGLPAVPGRAAHLHDCAASRVAARWTDARVVHRLDIATSGLLLFARGAAMQRAMSLAFAERRVHKGYTAWVHGLVAGAEGVIDLPLSADWPRRPRQKVDLQHGKPSTTGWRVLSRDAATGRTRLWLEPLTGRSHQLRVHLQAIGHPIVGDTLYGSDDTPSPRLLLHASTLGFEHPLLHEPLHLHSRAPF